MKPGPGGTPLAAAVRSPPQPKKPIPPTECPTCGRHEWGDDVIAAARAYIAAVVVHGVRERNGAARLSACHSVTEGPQNLSDEALEAEVKRRLALVRPPAMRGDG